jgi:hypothetical protein
VEGDGRHPHVVLFAARRTTVTPVALSALAFLGWTAAAIAAPAPAEPPPIWITGVDGGRFRVRFDPGERLAVGTGIDATAAGAVPAVELGMWLRSEPPAPDFDVYWKRSHEIAHLRLRPQGGGDSAAAIDGLVYRGLYLRQSREGTLTLPLAPPVAVPLPFDVGLLAEIGRLAGPLRLDPGGPPLEAGVVHGEVVADFLRSRRPGRWLLLGVGGRYEVGLSRDATGVLLADHRVSPMTALSVALHGESGGGLVSGGLRAEGGRRWSGARGWENAYRVEGEGEVIPLAVNDRPVSLFATAIADSGAGTGGPRPELRLVAGIRFSEPLR